MTKNIEKQKILEYARGKFISEGFFKTTMDELANELGVSKKTIYKYFPSKERLVEEVAGLQIREVTGELMQVINAKTNVVGKFAKIFDVYSSRIMCCSEKWYKDLQMHAPHVWRRIDNVRSQRINESLGKLIRQGRREGLIGNIPAEIVIASFVATIRAVMNPDFVSQNKFTMRDAFEYSFRMLLDGILTNHGKKDFNTKGTKNTKVF